MWAADCTVKNSAQCVSKPQPVSTSAGAITVNQPLDARTRPVPQAHVGHITMWTWADVARYGDWDEVWAHFDTWADVKKGE